MNPTNEAHVTVIARLVARPGQENTLAEALLSVSAPTKKEAGCLEYVVHSSKKDPKELIIYETWASEGALAAHHKMPYMGELMKKMPDLLAEPFSVSLLSKLS